MPTAQTLNPAFSTPGQVIDLLLLYGGDVEKFAGDCMIVVFLPTQQEAEGAHLPQDGSAFGCLPGCP